MSLLAAAGIYLVLDVNSPKVGESLNRYEPWTSYTPEYLTHILKVVDQFSGYNNTLGFFAGNEVVNDDKSATNSPHYIKAVIRDIKNYIRVRAPRTIPVGYSAADDLRYRVSLARYLECGDDQTSVDFYGVNSYQWCGTQTLQTSGYNVLLNDYHDYALPLFFSEYGCNAVLPRQFQEVECLYTSMTSVFSGGLVYEFTQEPNNYGLVETDTNGKVFLLPDFHKLKERYAKVRDTTSDVVLKSERPRQCLDSYDNLNTRNAIPDTFASKLIAEGAPVKRGRFVPVKVTATSLDIIDVDDSLIANKQIDIPDDWKRETPITAPRAVADLGSRDGEKPHPVAPIPLNTEHFSSTAQMVIPYISSIMAVILTWGWLLIKGYI
ncbi:1,3-beta-glucanosyltransferase Gas4p [Trichomonascus vanleenenianus]|uniref:1,3-beta-glucanosyltransferase n=1 Tax=Trichomonascus vanleenenianus TaxID=2268995 RepID=UPI003ECAD768